jgi:predicted AAA+ superfamily ATPase
MAKLKPWYDVVELRDDLKEGRPLDASEFAVHLDQVREGRATKDYTDPQRFFDRTYFTDSLLDLASQVVRRLSGNQVETSAVFNMSTQFGGGKSHALTALYHLAKNGAKANKWRSVESILLKAGVKSVPQADVAVFVGTEFDPIAGRADDGGPKRKTIWGEIAWQLGKAKGFAAVAEHDAKGVAPGGDVIREMLPAGPCMILTLQRGFAEVW